MFRMLQMNVLTLLLIKHDAMLMIRDKDAMIMHYECIMRLTNTRGVTITPQVLGLLFGHLHCMSLSLICSYTSMEHMRHVYIECACNTSLKHMQYTFVNCVSSVLGVHAW
jgi:hypothetical protein